MQDDRRDDEALVHRVALVQAHIAGVYGDDAVELADLVLAHALERWDAFVDTGEGSRARWAASIARNALRDQHRRSSTAQRSMPRLQLAEVDRLGQLKDPYFMFLEKTAQQRREELWAMLSAETRSVINVVQSVSASELSRAEAAQVLGTSLATYDKLAQRAKREIRLAVLTMGIDPAELFGMER